MEVYDADDAEAMARAASALRAGELVILPTETVYGLAACAEPRALARLRDAKGQRAQKPFARLVPDLARVAAAGARLPASARRLAERFWPGPLTLVLDVGRETVGFRVPGHPFARRLVAALDIPVVATSANRSGQPPPASFGAARDAVGPYAALGVDGGPCPLGVPSTVVRVAADGEAKILREGFLDRESIARVSQRLVVFVCTGNTCRSPMAAALFEAALARRLGVDPRAAGWSVASAGVAAARGAPAAANAVAVLRDRGLDIRQHRSRPLDEELVARAWRVIGLTPGHRQSIQEAWPEHAEKVLLLDPRGVPDPIGGDLATYRACAEHIERRLEHLLDTDLAVTSASTELRARFPTPADIPPHAEPDPDVDGARYLIGGRVLRWEGPCDPVHGVVCERGPGDELSRRVLGRIARLSGAVALEALDAAVAAWDLGRGPWPRAAVAERIAAVRSFAEAIRPERERVAKLLMWEVGKPYRSALAEFDRTIDYIDRTLEALDALDRRSSRVHTEGGVLAQVRRAPLGVTLCMGPFNYPLNETFTTLIPALCMGNTAVVKLPKLGRLCNLPLLEHLAACFPPGVVNVISGDGAELIGPIMSSGKVDVLAFIGSSTVAAIVEKQHPAPYRLTTVLGMDAKNPAVILPDADLELAVAQCVQGALSFNGQRCTALKTLYAHEDIADEFAARVSEAVESLPCGMPWEDEVVITPLPEDGKPERLTALLEDAVARGARVLNPRGGRTAGTLFFPAVLYPVAPDAELATVEQFGPLVPIVPFRDVAEVQSAIAESPYGQQVSLFGSDPAVLGGLIDALANQVCRINLNRYCSRGPDVFPFTGRKNSAEGTLSIEDALRTFSIESMVAASDPSGRPLVEEILAGGHSAFLHRRE